MEERVLEFLEGLAGRSAAPAGGASAALQAAQGAALVAMTARFCDRPMIAERMDGRYRRAFQLIEEDMAAYGAVLEAAPGHRRAALVEACRPQASVCDLASEVIEAAEPLAPLANRYVAPDLVAGVLAARSAAQTSALNVRANLLKNDDEAAQRMRESVVGAEQAIRAADDLVDRLAPPR